MCPSTVKLHRTVIRLLKGVLKAWEEWLETNYPDANNENKKYAKDTHSK